MDTKHKTKNLNIIDIWIWVSHLNIPRYFKIFLLHNVLLFI